MSAPLELGRTEGQPDDLRQSLEIHLTAEAGNLRRATARTA